ncbi:hypothetical protein KEM52_000790 [Ascosphaera acerosa]|nr:hypothetical protein KEM52_000790 [Ascosphaera acerosa]
MAQRVTPHVSNHAGRQIDGSIASLDALEQVVDAVGDRIDVMFDSGVRSGADIFKALALGAKFVFIGRLWVWALSIGGEDGVRHMMKSLLAEFDILMEHAGFNSIKEITRDAIQSLPPTANLIPSVTVSDSDLHGWQSREPCFIRWFGLHYYQRKSPTALKMDSDHFRTAAHAAINEIIAYFQTIEKRPVVPRLKPGYLRPLLPDVPPEQPQSWEDIQQDIAAHILPGLTHWQHPNFMAFFPATVSFPSILGEMYSAAFTAPGFNWLCSPAATELETVVMDWLAKALGLSDCFRSLKDNGEPCAGGGVIHGSASEAVLTTIVAARERHIREQACSEGLAEGTEEWEDRAMELRSRLVALASDQAHSCTAKGARIAGVRFRTVQTSFADNLEMTGPAVKAQLLRCEAAGLRPFFLTCSFGTTNTVAVDRLEEIKAVLQEKDEWKRIWVHVDAAYAGAAMICEEHQNLARALDKGVDSYDMNTHKWLLVNFDASCLFVRNHRDLTAALDLTPPYLRNPGPLTGVVTDYRNWQIPLGRRFRALKIWFVMRSYGLVGLRAHIRRTIALGDLFAKLASSRSDLFTMPTTPAFGLTCLRVNGQTCMQKLSPLIASPSRRYMALPSREEMASDAVTLRVAELVNEDGEIYITHSVALERTILRVVSTNERADDAHVRRAFKILVRHTEDVLNGKVVLAQSHEPN